MNKEELEKRLEEIENSLFYLNMKDHWMPEDYSYKHSLECERIDVKRKLKEVEE